MNSSMAALLPQLADTDLVRTMPRLDVPIVMAQGRLDQVAPGFMNTKASHFANA
jgi:hypothetical protein